MNTPDYYERLVTSEHRDLPLFNSSLQALVRAFIDRASAEVSLVDKFDLDLAVGVQLDDVGLWVGVSRRLRTALVGVYFSWDGTTQLGWDAGSWKGPFDPDSGLTLLPDDVYRRLIRGRIAANFWDGTIPGAAAVWAIAFAGSQRIIIQDNQDMSMTVGFTGGAFSTLDQALLTEGYLPLKPAGVRISTYAVPVDANPLFAWDVEGTTMLTDGSGVLLTTGTGDFLVAADTSALLSGWTYGSWALELNPN
jgi:Protein of unknown function (DUF2612)